MAIEYDEWNRFELQQTVEACEKANEKASRGEKITPTSMVPETNLKEDDVYTLWLPPGLFGAGSCDLPTTSLANLLTTYQKVIVPIPVFSTESDFESSCSMSVGKLIRIFEDNRDRYVPIIAAAPINYKPMAFYEPLFATCKRLYGYYPPFTAFRIDKFQLSQALAALTGSNAITHPNWQIRQSFPEFEMHHVRNVEVEDLLAGKVASMQALSTARGTTADNVRSELATNIIALRAYGHVELTKFLLQSYYPKYPDLHHLYQLLHDYQSYLIQPLNGCLGGFSNYASEDLELMAFLRVLPIEGKSINELEQANMRLLMNSPAARSSLTIDEFKTQVFLRGGDDVNTLNSLAEFAERHKKEIRAMAEYRRYIATANLSQATEQFRTASEGFAQLGEEIKELARTTRLAKLGVYAVRGGVTFLTGTAMYLVGQNLPSEWRSVVAGLSSVATLLSSKDYDPKKLIEWVYDTRVWPWYEKGVPYLYWKAL